MVMAMSREDVVEKPQINEGEMGYGNAFLYISTGLVAGLLSGLIGIGGGTIIVTILLFIFGFSQKMAQ